jgi:hypothetical protein
MGLTVEQAKELRVAMLAKKKAERKVRVDEIVSASLTLEVVEKKLRAAISSHPENRCVNVTVLNVVLNDWDCPDRAVLREEVLEQLKKKYKTAFLGCDVDEYSVGNQGLGVYLAMRL